MTGIQKKNGRKVKKIQTTINDEELEVKIKCETKAELDYIVKQLDNLG